MKRCSNRLIFHTFWLVIWKLMRIRIRILLVLWCGCESGPYLSIWCGSGSKTRDLFFVFVTSLILSLLQVVIGTAKLVATPKYFPLRFHCCQILSSLSATTGIHAFILCACFFFKNFLRGICAFLYYVWFFHFLSSKLLNIAFSVFVGNIIIV